jgi:hypothetical protein
MLCVPDTLNIAMLLIIITTVMLMTYHTCIIMHIKIIFNLVTELRYFMYSYYLLSISLSGAFHFTYVTVRNAKCPPLSNLIFFLLETQFIYNL